MNTATTITLFIIFSFITVYIVFKLFYLLRINILETKTIKDFDQFFPGEFIQSGNNRIHIIRKGTGIPVIFIHGIAGSTYTWETSILDDLAQDYNPILMDLYGMGFSERNPDFPYTFSFWADQILAVLDNLDIKKAIIAGHSLGGAIAAIFAAKYSDRAEKLILIAPTSPAKKIEAPLIYFPFFIPGLRDAILALSKNFTLKSSPEKEHKRYNHIYSIKGSRYALKKYIKSGAEFDVLWNAYPEIKCPTLIVCGENDYIVPYRFVKRTENLIQNKKVVLLKDTGHWIMKDSKSILLNELQQFISSYKTDSSVLAD